MWGHPSEDAALVAHHQLSLRRPGPRGPQPHSGGGRIPDRPRPAGADCTSLKAAPGKGGEDGQEGALEASSAGWSGRRSGARRLSPASCREKPASRWPVSSGAVDITCVCVCVGVSREDINGCGHLHVCVCVCVCVCVRRGVL